MNIAAALLTSLLLATTVFAEDVTLETKTETAEAGVLNQKKLELDKKRAEALLEKKKVTYGGFLHDVSLAENKRKFFSLRRPRDRSADTKNISYDERTARPRGFVLFRLEF